MTGGNLWTRRTWTAHDDKHAPIESWSWIKTLKSSQGRVGVARYHPQLTRERWEQIELASIRDEFEIPTKKPAVRIFCREVAAEESGVDEVGAAEGEGTSWIHVEWQENPQGYVHGRPILQSRVHKLIKNSEGR